MKEGAIPDVRVYESLEEMSRAAADLIASCSEVAQGSSRGTAIALSGGATPARLFAILAAQPYRERIDWSTLHLFWTDERCVPPDNDASNYGLLKNKLLSKVMVPGVNIHRIRGEAGPERAAREYETSLSLFFGKGIVPVFDLIVLGVGADGHTASLFPGSPELHERTRFAVPVPRDPPDVNRVSLTLSVLLAAEKILFLASGRAKAAIVRELLEQGKPERYPAGLVKPERGTLVWMVDRDAASFLSGRAG